MKNLFTQLPSSEALRVIEKKLTSNQSLPERTNIPAPQLVEPVELCLRSSYLQFQDSVYEQVDGRTMGSPLSPVVANLYMESLEEAAIITALLQPNLWVHYVDDTFVIWTHRQDELHRFHQHLSKHHFSIQFTMEEKSGCKLTFLDVLVTRNEEAAMSRHSSFLLTTCCRKTLYVVPKSALSSPTQMTLKQKSHKRPCELPTSVV